MSARSTITAVFLAFFAVLPGLSGNAAAQVPQLPPGVTPEQAAEMVQQRPELGEIVQRQLLESGLSADQIRSRLRSFGFSGSLLDSYFNADSVTGLPDPTQGILQAMTTIGVGGFSTADSLLLSGDTTALRMFSDSVRADSIRQAEELARITRPFELFGLSVFRQATTQFQPITSAPVGGSYRVGPGDVLVLIITGQVEKAHTLEVTREGFVFVPQVGQVYVSNLSLDQLDTVFYDRLRQVYSGISRGPNPRTRFNLTVAQVRSVTVRVAGEVAIPGTYTISAAAGPLSALYQAGGLMETSNFRDVRVLRGSEVAYSLDLYDYLTRGSVNQEFLLTSGDIIFVPPRGSRVKIAGEVVRPGIYEIRPSETLADLIRYAGGLTELAASENATVDRIIPPTQRDARGIERTVLTVSLASVFDSTVGSVPLESGDSVTVYSIPELIREFVSVQGAVWQPGTYRLESGMRLHDALEVAGGSRPEAYLGRVQILRTFADSTTQLLGAPLSGSDDDPLVNPELREFDQITVFSQASFREQRFVGIWGEVQSPGIIEFADSMTLRDAILLAGGITEGAYMLTAEVSRLRGERSLEDSLVTLLHVPLDSSFVTGWDEYRERSVATTRPAVVLNPYDNIFVRRQPGWETQRNVVLTGEVLFPGRYSLAAPDERLLDLIDRAGGLTARAYANGVQFFRFEGDAGRIGVNLPAVLQNSGHADNLALVAGDSIHIPRYIPTVRVEGAVNSPSSVPYIDGRDMRYYIDAAGGFSNTADEGRRFVQQPNGLIQRDVRPEPGAVVVVPAKDPNDQGLNVVALVTGVSSVLASLVTVIVVLAR